MEKSRSLVGIPLVYATCERSLRRWRVERGVVPSDLCCHHRMAGNRRWKWLWLWWWVESHLPRRSMRGGCVMRAPGVWGTGEAGRVERR